MVKDIAFRARTGFAGLTRLRWDVLGIAAIAFVYLAAHLAELLVFAGQAQIVSYTFLIGAPLLATVACLSRARSRGMAQAGAISVEAWYVLALALFLWACGMAASMYIDVLHGGDGVSGLSVLLYVFYGVPLTFLVASPRQDVWAARLIDAVLCLALGALLFAGTFTFATVTGADAAGMRNIQLMFDVQNLFVLVFSGVRYAAEDDPGQKEVFRVTTVFAGIYLATAAYINHAEIDSRFGILSDLVIDIPFLALFVMAGLATAPAETAPRRKVNPLGVVVRTASPMMLPLTLFAMSCLLVFHKPAFAVAGFVTALFGYSARSILIQVRTLADKGRLEQLSRTDALTELSNRRHFDEALAREFNRSRRSQQPLALLMIDIDHFKMLNDAYGHPEGDRYLRTISRTLADCAARAGDVAARYGGEEFAVILPNTDAEAALTVADKIRNSVAELGLASPASRGIATVSIGVASTERAGAGDATRLLSAADAALYRAKQDGRNRVAIER